MNHQICAKLGLLASIPEPAWVSALFAAGVAMRKWQQLQSTGFQMQSLRFSRADGQAGQIDLWGVVSWDADPEPFSQGHPTQKAVIAQRAHELGRVNGILLEALGQIASAEPLAWKVKDDSFGEFFEWVKNCASQAVAKAQASSTPDDSAARQF